MLHLVTPECSTAVRKIGGHRHNLEQLPINTLLALLYGRDVISIKEKRTMDNITLPSDKMTYLLDDILIRSLQSGDMVKFNKFCEVLEEKGHTAMAKRLGLLIYCILVTKKVPVTTSLKLYVCCVIKCPLLIMAKHTQTPEQLLIQR